MDSVYIIGQGSRWDDNELRYSIRSLVKHFKGLDKIFIVGHKPKWITNVYHIPAEDKDGTQYKEQNICNKIKAACHVNIVSEDFVLINDDHFFLQDTGNLPNYYDGTIADRLKRNKNSYHISLTNTERALSQVDLPTKYFDIHCPIVCNKKDFLKSMWGYDWDIKRGYCVKTLHLNTMQEMGIPAKDFKVTRAQDIDLTRPYFSISDDLISPVFERFMETLYQDKSKYEL